MNWGCSAWRVVGTGESDNGYGTVGVDRMCSGSRRRKGPAAEGDTSED